MLINVNRCTHLIKQKGMNIELVSIQLRLKNYDWVHGLTEHIKKERIRIARETLKLLNDGKPRHIYRIIANVET